MNNEASALLAPLKGCENGAMRAKVEEDPRVALALVTWLASGLADAEPMTELRGDHLFIAFSAVGGPVNFSVGGQGHPWWTRRDGGPLISIVSGSVPDELAECSLDFVVHVWAAVSDQDRLLYWPRDARMAEIDRIAKNLSLPSRAISRLMISAGNMDV